MSPCVGGYVLSAARAVKDVRVADRVLAMWDFNSESHTERVALSRQTTL